MRLQAPGRPGQRCCGALLGPRRESDYLKLHGRSRCLPTSPMSGDTTPWVNCPQESGGYPQVAAPCDQETQVDEAMEEQVSEGLNKVRERQPDLESLLADYRRRRADYDRARGRQAEKEAAPVGSGSRRRYTV